MYKKLLNELYSFKTESRVLIDHTATSCALKVLYDYVLETEKRLQELERKIKNK